MLPLLTNFAFGVNELAWAARAIELQIQSPLHAILLPVLQT